MNDKNPLGGGLLIQSMPCSSIVADAQPQTQSPKWRSPLSPSSVLRFVELLTLLPYCRFSSRLLDRAVLTAEAGRAA